MKLLSGQRFRLQREDAFLRVLSGTMEAYAVTRERNSFQQVFLMELAAGDAAFPALDEFHAVDIFLYAAGDAECEEISFQDMEAAELCPLMRRWFRKLMDTQWLQRIADKGDDMLLPWKDGSVLAGRDGDHGKLMEDFRENEGIFSMMVGMKFHGADRKHAERMRIRARQKKELMDEAVGLLLGEKDRIIYEEGQGNAALDPLAYQLYSRKKKYSCLLQIKRCIYRVRKTFLRKDLTYSSISTSLLKSSESPHKP